MGSISSSSPRTGPSPAAAVTVDATPSAIPAETAIVSYEWDFGDGTEAAGKTASHTYSGPGRFCIRLTVTDDIGLSSSATRCVSVPCPSDSVAPWSAADIGARAFSGSSRFEGEEGGLELCAGGRLLSGPSDQLHFVYREIDGDVVLSARIAQAHGAEDR